MPVVPVLGIRFAGLRLEEIKLTIAFLANIIHEEGIVMRNWTVIIMLNFSVPYEIIDKMLQRNARVVSLQQIPFVILVISHIFSCSFPAPGSDLLVIKVV